MEKVFVGFIRDHKTRIGRINAVNAKKIKVVGRGCKS